MNLASVFSHIKAATKGLAAKLRPRPPAMIGTPPSARQIPAHPELHARRAKGGSHDYAYEHAPNTALPIRPQARELARMIRDGERRSLLTHSSRRSSPPE